ncbi:MAG: glycosyltransferase [Desulfobacterales bacterium]|nr:glycosyltransferase [Desulfobacterales bacterium]
MIPSADTAPRIAIFASFSGKGGVERMLLNLAEGFAGIGCQVDLLMIKSSSLHLETLPQGLNIIQLNANHTWSSLSELAGYLQRARPEALLAAKDRANQVAILARRLSRTSTRLGVRMGTHVSAAIAGKGGIKKVLWYLPIRLLYRQADEIVAVSEGVKEDLMRITGLPPERITVIANPAVSNRIYTLAAAPNPHPWFNDTTIPVVLGAGRLTRQKDFPTLVRAFAKVKAVRACRLIILGDGNDREKLLSLAWELKIDPYIDLPGFVSNPYAYLRRASLFALSSIWEGSPNVLTEALALGTPAVATDCRSGPREILKDGSIGRLVPVGDPDALATAILETLSAPPDETLLKTAVSEYTVEFSSRRYLNLLLGKTTP